MPTGPKDEKRPADVIGNAVKVMQIAREIEDPGRRYGDGAVYRDFPSAAKVTSMGQKKMLILRGNADSRGNQYPDEQGKNVAWPIGALHVKAAEDYAKSKQYIPETIQVEGYPQSNNSPQAQEVLKRFVGLKYTGKGYTRDSSLTPDQDIKALYGFSGGGYNLWHILQYLARDTPDDLRRIERVVVIGVEKEIRSRITYHSSTYNALAKRTVHPEKWDPPVNWDLVYHTNPDSSLLPKGLPKNTKTHMFGPDVLLSGDWKEET